MIEEKGQILVVDDEANLRRVLAAQLERDGYEVHTAEDGESAYAFLKEHHVDLVISDLRMPKMGGMELLRKALREDAQLPVIILTAHGTVDNAVEALKTGAFDYISKPFDQNEVRMIVSKGLRTRELARRDARRQGEATETTSGARFGIIGGGQKIKALYDVIDRVAAAPTTVLISGESGTGKELVARALHENSERSAQAFIKVNCAAIPKDLMESELFGHEKGAFTGAVSSKPGRFELANGGSLFLDEVGEIPLEMQVKLLRVLQESEFERVGGIKTIRVDVRLIAATNRDLKHEISEGTFREDLYYRFNVVPIVIPTLRDRREDLPQLVSFFINKFNERLKKQVLGIDDEVMALFLEYGWPGNIRELENIIERAVLFADGERISVGDLSPELRERALGGAAESGVASEPVSPERGLSELGLSTSSAPDMGLKEQVKAASNRLERDLIGRALQQTGGNVTHAARLLKISRKGLQLKMKELGLRERGGD